MSSVSTGVRAGRLWTGRRSIHDRAQAVVGYQLRFQPDGEPAPSDRAAAPSDRAERDAATSEMIAAAFAEFPIARFGPRRHLYLNLTRRQVLGEVPMPFGPDHVVLHLTEDLEIDTKLLEGLDKLRHRGYRLGIDNSAFGPLDLADLLPMTDVVMIDVGSSADPEEMLELIRQARQDAPQARLMAESIDSGEQLKAALKAGFQLFQGSYFEPVPDQHAGVNLSQTLGLQLLAALSDPETPLNRLMQIVSADPGLSVKILGSVNSTAGAGRHITSLSQAIVLLGRRPLSAWVMMAVLGGAPTERRQDMIAVLTRARACELLAPLAEDVEQSAAYLLGLLSGAVEIMGSDPVELARTTGLDQDLTEALLEHRGPIGELLAGVEQFERTGRAGGGIGVLEVARAHLHALGIAVDTIDSILGEPG